MSEQKYVDLTPTWRGLLPMLIEVAANGTSPEGRKQATDELYRLADAADKLTAINRAKATDVYDHSKVAATATHPFVIRWDADLCSRCGEKHPFTEREKEIIQYARSHYATGSDNDLEIDDEPKLSAADDGTWVAAWVWVPDEEIELCKPS